MSSEWDGVGAVRANAVLGGPSTLLQREGGFGEAVAVDLEFDAVVAWVVAAGGEVAEGLFFGEVESGSGGEGDFGPFEDLLGGVFVGSNVVDDVVDGESLSFA